MFARVHCWSFMWTYFIAHSILEAYSKDWEKNKQTKKRTTAIKHEQTVSNSEKMILDLYYASKRKVEPLLCISIS